MKENPNRRTLLNAGMLGGGALIAALAGCAPEGPTGNSRPAADQPSRTTTAAEETGTKTLLAYFSRAGENYFYGGRRILEVGNTEVLATMIGDRIPCDVYRIEEALPYPESYDETVSRNAQEQRANARPPIANPLPDVRRYDTVLIGSPVWSVRAPMIISTFLEGVGLAGKTVLPFVTYAVSGMGNIEDDYRGSLPTSEVRPGLAVRGEETSAAAPILEDWLRQSRLIR
ncbi:flavodoxin [Paeniglutamicibacter sp. ORCA_105]|uniref:flavodoxin n=1 Tax=Paeniglutamicibacter sp. ORCA_105 TaxID=3377336 RepID=UPI003895DC0F